ncbi:N-acetyldiaminopimelate deacetylase [Jeotgalibacillus soli]|uniref:N-acetyldiaminopimelate deacetylase n=1 Tax=Jeotgalibacillus soli TaxID=889306 RepID=A0A0C2V6X1_9BACL|nr:N-acetyldiaminopimelate deacetylase [Jeotgalibacillus soli]KIL44712.1 N-acetyldiaminopimelate deacetylase [Jeotgalibacillus soli]
MSTFIHIRRDLHKIPEIGYQEFKTQKYLLNYIKSLTQDRIEIKTWKTGIFVKVNGTAPKKMIGYRADIDGLPITEQSGVPFPSEHPGYMHACGHDLHMSIALGILTNVVEQPIEDDVLMIFQPAEEGPGGAEQMLASAIMKEWMPNVIIGLHIAPEYKVGEVATKPGLLFANTTEIHIELKGKGGHAAYPHHTRDMIVAGASLITQLQTIVARNVDPLDSAVVTIGKLEAGTVGNIIAETAKLDGTMRTLNPEAMVELRRRVTAIVTGIEHAFECEASLDFGQPYYQVYNDEKLTNTFMKYVEQYPDVQLIHCRESMTGEDFGYFLKDIPGFMFWLGVESEYGLHHAKLNPDEESINVAIDLISSFLRSKHYEKTE